MRFDTTTFAIALNILLTAQSAQAGPIRWTGRIYRRSTPINGESITTSSAPTAAHDGYYNPGNRGSETTPRPIFQTLTSSLPYPDPGSSETSRARQSTVEAPAVDTTEIQSETPVTSVEQSSAAPSSAYPVDSTDLAESSTITKSIFPEQPTGTPSATNTPVETRESTAAPEEETSPVEATSAATSDVIVTTTIVPKQPGSGTDASSADGTPTSAAGTFERTSAAPATQSIITSSIVPKQPGEGSSAQHQTPGASSAASTTVDLYSSPAASSPLYETAPTPSQIPGTTPGSSIVNTPTGTKEAVPGDSSTTAAYQDTPSYTATSPDQDKHYPTSALMQSSIDLGGLRPTSAGGAVSTAIQESSTAAVPPTSAANGSQPSLDLTSELATTPTISVGNPDGTSAGGSTDDVSSETSPAQSTPITSESLPTQASSSPAASSEPLDVSSTAAADTSAASTITPTGTPNTVIPTVGYLPTATATVDPNQYDKNLAQAKELNEMYSGLTADSACTASQAACIDGKFAQCNDGKTYTLTTCDGDEKCYALPANTANGVILSCQSPEKAKEILGTTGDNDQETTSPAEQPVSSSAAETPVATSEAKEPNYPVVTVTQVVTVDDGATSTASEPVQQQTTEPVQPSEPTTTVGLSTVIVVTSSKPTTTEAASPVVSFPAVSSPAESSPATSSPAASSPAESSPDTATPEVPVATTFPAAQTSESHTVIVITRTRPATTEASAPVEDTPTTEAPVASTTSAPADQQSSASPDVSSLPDGSNTITKSIKTPGYPDPSATSQGESEAEPTQASTVLLVPINKSRTTAPAAAATEAAVKDQGNSTTKTVDGTPTVSVYYTVTVTEKDRETVTVTQHDKETITVVISA